MTEAPSEIRGEFRPIPTNVPGVDICELMPLRASIAHRYAIVRNLQTVDTHSAELLMRGTLTGPRRPVFGSVVSKAREGAANPFPPYVALGGENGSDPGDPAYLGASHRPFTGGTQNIALTQGMTLDRLGDRRGIPYTPSNLLATLYQGLGIDPGRTFPDFNGRPMYLLDDRQPIAELI